MGSNGARQVCAVRLGQLTTMRLAVCVVPLLVVWPKSWGASLLTWLQREVARPLLALPLASCTSQLLATAARATLCCWGACAHMRRKRADVQATCAICLEDLVGGVDATLPCGHVFHKGCAAEWLSRSARCPFRCEGHARPRRRNALLLRSQEEPWLAGGKDAQEFAASGQRRAAAARALAAALFARGA